MSPVRRSAADPFTTAEYVYANLNPPTYVDPTGEFTSAPWSPPAPATTPAPAPTTPSPRAGTPTVWFVGLAIFGFEIGFDIGREIWKKVTPPQKQSAHPCDLPGGPRPPCYSIPDVTTTEPDTEQFSGRQVSEGAQPNEPQQSVANDGGPAGGSENEPAADKQPAPRREIQNAPENRPESSEETPGVDTSKAQAGTAEGGGSPTAQTSTSGATGSGQRTDTAASASPAKKQQEKVHGNCKASQNTQCVYVIRDTKTGRVYKVGITGQGPNRNGTYQRADKQVNKLNRREGSQRYEVDVIEEDIPGRKKALEREQQEVDRVYEETGRAPPGNKLPEPSEVKKQKK